MLVQFSCVCVCVFHRNYMTLVRGLHRGATVGAGRRAAFWRPDIRVDLRSQDRTGPQTGRDVGRREGSDRAERENGALSRQRVRKGTSVQCEVSEHHQGIATGLAFSYRLRRREDPREEVCQFRFRCHRGTWQRHSVLRKEPIKPNKRPRSPALSPPWLPQITSEMVISFGEKSWPGIFNGNEFRNL